MLSMLRDLAGLWPVVMPLLPAVAWWEARAAARGQTASALSAAAIAAVISTVAAVLVFGLGTTRGIPSEIGKTAAILVAVTLPYLGVFAVCWRRRLRPDSRALSTLVRAVAVGVALLPVSGIATLLLTCAFAGDCS